MRPIIEPGEEKTEKERAAKTKRQLHDQLLTSLQMQHLVVLAGSGTSLGPTVGGPSMRKLWDHCVNTDPDRGAAPHVPKPQVAAMIAEVGYDTATNKENVEALLSQCDAYLQFKSGATNIAAFVKASKETILKECLEFLDPSDESQLETHRTFLQKLSRCRRR